MTNLTADTFDAEVLQAQQPVVVDFWAAWCGPCMMLAPIMEELEAELPGVRFCKVNVDEQMELAIRFGVESIPMLLVFKNGKIADTLIGYRPKDALKKQLEAAL